MNRPNYPGKPPSDYHPLDHQCPNCGANNDSVSAVADPARAPTPGSILMCIYCGLVSEITEDGPALMPEEKMDAVMREPELLKAIYARANMAARGLIPHTQGGKALREVDSPATSV